MKASGKFNFGGANLTNSNGETVEIKNIEFQGEVEYSAQELIQLLASNEKSVKEFLGFLVKDLPTVIRESGNSLVQVAANARNMKREQRLADVRVGLKDLRHYNEFAGERKPFTPNNGGCRQHNNNR